MASAILLVALCGFVAPVFAQGSTEPVSTPAASSIPEVDAPASTTAQEYAVGHPVLVAALVLVCGLLLAAIYTILVLNLRVRGPTGKRLVDLAEFLLGWHHPHLARLAAKRHLHLAPNDADALSALARASEIVGRTQDAEWAYITMARTSQNGHEYALCLREAARMALQRNDAAQAERYLHRAGRLDATVVLEATQTPAFSQITLSRALLGPQQTLLPKDVTA